MIEIKEFKKRGKDHIGKWKWLRLKEIELEYMTPDEEKEYFMIWDHVKSRNIKIKNSILTFFTIDDNMKIFYPIQHLRSVNIIDKEYKVYFDGFWIKLARRLKNFLRGEITIVTMREKYREINKSEVKNNG